MSTDEKEKKKKDLAPAAMEKFIDGKDIQHVPVDLEMSQAELAAEMGIAAATLSRIITGKCVMSRPYYKLFVYTVKDLQERTGRTVGHSLRSI